MEYRVCGPELERGRDDWSVAPVPIPEAESRNTHPVPVELVLRRRDGSFLPVSYLLNTFCHEVRSDRSCIGIISHLCPRCFDYAIPFLILNPLMTPRSLSFRSADASRPRLLPNDSHTQIPANDCTNLYLLHVQLTNSPPFISRAAGAYQTHESQLAVPTAVEQASFAGFGPSAERVLWRRCA